MIWEISAGLLMIWVISDTGLFEILMISEKSFNDLVDFGCKFNDLMITDTSFGDVDDSGKKF